MKSVKLRRYEPGDQQGILAVNQEAMDQVDAHPPGETYDDLRTIEDTYFENGDFLVALLNEEVVGMAALKPRDGQTAEITRMRVSPRAQGHGIATELLAELEARARELEYETCWLQTTVRQQAARALYESAGYRETEREQIGEYDVRTYEKEL